MGMNKSQKSKKCLDKIKPGVNLSIKVAKLLPQPELSSSYESKTGREVLLYVDTKFERELFRFLQSKPIMKKFRMVAEFAISDRYDDDLYGHESSSSKSKDICAIKICVLGNYRIYCKEFFKPNQKKIVLIKLVNKKTNEFSNELRKLVDRLGEYEYDFQE